MAMRTPDIREPAIFAAAPSNDTGLRVAWGGVWSGLLVAIGTVLLLGTLGLAIGMTAVDVGPGENPSAGNIGMGAAIWSGLTLLIALFVGGMVATRSGAVHDRAAGMVEGALVWVLAMLALIYLAGTGLGAITGASFGALRGVAQGAVTATASSDLGDLSSADPRQLLQKLDDPKTAQVVAAVTGTSQADARAKLADIRQKIEAAGDDPQRAAQAAREGLDGLKTAATERISEAAQRAQPYAKATMWSTLLAMVVALAAALGGAMVGRRQVLARFLRIDERAPVLQRSVA